MSSTRILQDQLRQAHQFLATTMVGVSDGIAHWPPPGIANPLGATYAHLVLGEDAFVAALAERPALFESSWSGRAGVNELPPLRGAGELIRLHPEWHDWGQRVRVDLPALRDYASAVHLAAEGYLAGLGDQDLDRHIDLTAEGFGEQSLVWLLSAGMVGHVFAHWGEIACLKGLQGHRGLPV